MDLGRLLKKWAEMICGTREGMEGRARSKRCQSMGRTLSSSVLFLHSPKDHIAGLNLPRKGKRD